LRLDTSKCPAKALTGVLDAIEEFKRAAATENIREGLIAARKRGIKLGRPQTVNAHREDVKRLRAQGLTGRAIAKELGIPSSTAFKLIKDNCCCHAGTGGCFCFNYL
jgi:DNA invertase Pin-like site-specific DNA recombinase